MTYKFRKVGRVLVCIDQSLTNAFATLFIGYAKNHLDSLGVSKANVRAAIKAIVKSKLGLSRNDKIILLPEFGHLGMKVHRGVKVFDFDRSEVTKLFADGLPAEEALAEISASRTAAFIPAAPRHLMSDSRGTWLREEYISGTHATQLVAEQSSAYLRYYQDVEDCLIELVRCQRPVMSTVTDHLDSLDTESFRKKWLAAGLNESNVDLISGYAGKIRHWIIDYADDLQLPLVLTHGDFSLVNAIATEEGLRFVDWEGIAPGGVFSDIFNFLFVERYYGRVSEDFPREFADFFQTYRLSIRAQLPELRESTELAPVFLRRLYYIERLSLLLGREVSENLRDVILKSIAMFEAFDEEAGDIDPQVQDLERKLAEQ